MEQEHPENLESSEEPSESPEIPDPPDASQFDESYKKRTDAISQTMGLKERFCLASIAYEYPESYFQSWKQEVNAYFSLLVIMRHRKRLIDDHRRKTQSGSEAAEEKKPA